MKPIDVTDDSFAEYNEKSNKKNQTKNNRLLMQ